MGIFVPLVFVLLCSNEFVCFYICKDHFFRQLLVQMVSVGDFSLSRKMLLGCSLSVNAFVSYIS